MEAKLLEVVEKNQQLARHTNEALTEKVNRCLCGFVIWQIETQKWLKLRDLERRVTTIITCSGGGQRQLARKLDSNLSGLEETKENLELKLSAVLRMLGLHRSSAGVLTAGLAGIAPVASSRHSK